MQGKEKKASKTNYFRLKEISEQQHYYDNKAGILISYPRQRSPGAKKEMNELLNRYYVQEEATESNASKATDIVDDLKKELNELNKRIPIIKTSVDCLMFCPLEGNMNEVLTNMFHGALQDNYYIKELLRLVPLQKVVVSPHDC